MGSNVFDRYASATTIVLLHMLKWDAQPALRSRSWVCSIINHRDRMTELLAQNPSFKPRRAEAIARAYRAARIGASKETGLPLGTFPDVCLYDWDAITARPHPLPGDDA